MGITLDSKTSDSGTLKWMRLLNLRKIRVRPSETTLHGRPRGSCRMQR